MLKNNDFIPLLFNKKDIFMISNEQDVDKIYDKVMIPLPQNSFIIKCTLCGAAIVYCIDWPYNEIHEKYIHYIWHVKHGDVLPA